jgi:hypothetical protein
LSMTQGHCRAQRRAERSEERTRAARTIIFRHFRLFTAIFGRLFNMTDPDQFWTAFRK